MTTLNWFGFVCQSGCLAELFHDRPMLCSIAPGPRWSGGLHVDQCLVLGASPPPPVAILLISRYPVFCLLSFDASAQSPCRLYPINTAALSLMP
ncbi:hypothetical protein BJ166DRAFT_43673 [Pestalotiopsis sp. NC0098]|nr:hypothetical protein BJ166DRAFT_43673 [Pestalotiopsis sp. NC0098]